MQRLYDEGYARYQIKRSFIRRFIRRFYLKNILRHVKGSAIDFGCGRGELLSLLPAGSIGFEINKSLLEYCRAKGLEVYHYSPEEDRYELKGIISGRFNTFIMYHVLEHIAEPLETLKRLFTSCRRIGVERIIIGVPGWRGFYSDKTHLHFIDMDFLKRFDGLETYYLQQADYFPFNLSWAGKFFTYNELVTVYLIKN